MRRTGRMDSRIATRLRELRERGTTVVYCVVGAGHGGVAMAGHLGILGYPVHLYNRSDDKLEGVRWKGGITVDGQVQGFGPVRRATSDMAEAIDGADVIMVVTPSTAHKGLASLMAPHLVAGQMVVLNPGRTGGALEVRKVLRESAASEDVIVGETQTFLYASRAVGSGQAHVFRIKNSVPFATLPSYWIPDALGVLNVPFPQFVAGTNVLATSLENIGAIFHPALTLLNTGWIEATRGDFDYYSQGITPSVAKLLERMDAERLAVASALGVRSVSAREWLYLTYDSPGRDLHEAIKNTAGYVGIKAPPTIAHRYVTEDVPMSLVPLSSLGAMLGVRTPVIDMIIEFGSILHGTDYRAQGRTVETLGLSGLTVKQIRPMVSGIRRSAGQQRRTS